MAHNIEHVKGDSVLTSLPLLLSGSPVPVPVLLCKLRGYERQKEKGKMTRFPLNERVYSKVIICSLHSLTMLSETLNSNTQLNY